MVRQGRPADVLIEEQCGSWSQSGYCHASRRWGMACFHRLFQLPGAGGQMTPIMPWVSGRGGGVLTSMSPCFGSTRRWAFGTGIESLDGSD